MLAQAFLGGAHRNAEKAIGKHFELFPSDETPAETSEQHASIAWINHWFAGPRTDQFVLTGEWESPPNQNP